jgi:hypothetical protein
MAFPVLLPCACGSAVHVTSRYSKQRERPRNHACPQCGKRFRVKVMGSRVTDISKG